MPRDRLMSFDDSAVASIRQVSHFRDSIYRNLDIPPTIDFFTRRYVLPLDKCASIAGRTAVDCAAGYGWFSIAFILAGGGKAILADVDEARLLAAREIAGILGVAGQMEFIHSPVEELSLDEDSADFFVSIETMEHVGKSAMRPALRKMRHVASRAILLTSPNKLFPLVAHDGRIPLWQWLPAATRRRILRAAGSRWASEQNDFLSPLDLRILRDKFQPASSCLNFASWREWRDLYPFYLPYGEDDRKRLRQAPSSLQSTWYRFAASALGENSHWVMPNLACIFLRR